MKNIEVYDIDEILNCLIGRDLFYIFLKNKKEEKGFQEIIILFDSLKDDEINEKLEEIKILINKFQKKEVIVLIEKNEKGKKKLKKRNQ
jgi:hypothetical protein